MCTRLLLYVLIKSFPGVIQLAASALPERRGVASISRRGVCSFPGYCLMNVYSVEINAISAHCTREINAIVDNTYSAITRM